MEYRHFRIIDREFVIRFVATIQTCFHIWHATMLTTYLPTSMVTFTGYCRHSQSMVGKFRAAMTIYFTFLIRK